MALAHYNIAASQMADRQYDRSLESLEKSLKYRSELVATHPSVTQFRQNLGETYEVIADVQHRIHQDDKAFLSLRMSFDILEKLVQSYPDRALHHGFLGRSYNTLGFFHDELRQNLEAIPAFERAVSEQELAIARSPDDGDYQALLGNHLENLGEQYVDLGQVDRGLPYYRRGIQVRRRLFTAHPDNHGYRLDLAEALRTLGNVERHAGDLAAARKSFSEARSLLDGGAVVTSGNSLIQVHLGAVLVEDARTLIDMREPDQARPLLNQAVKVLSDVSVTETDQALRCQWLSAALWELATIARVLESAGEADRIARSRVALWQDRSAEELADLALKQTTVAVLIGYGKTTVSPLALKVRQHDLDQAAADLKLAVALGFRDLRLIRSHPDSSTLLSRDDLRLTIMDLEFPVRPFAE